MFKTFKEYAILKEAANRSISHLLSLAHSDRMMVVISSFRQGQDQLPPRSSVDLQRDIRSMQALEIIPNPACAIDSRKQPEVLGANHVAKLPPSTKLGFTKAIGGFKEKKIGIDGNPELDADGKEVHYDVCEDSVVVSCSRGHEPTDEQAIEFFIGLCKKYRQEGFLFKSPSSTEIQLIGDTGSAMPLGQMRPASVIDLYFTHLRKGTNNNERRIKAVSNDL
jgi:hypothetical protein